VKPKIGTERTLQDYVINGYVLHHGNIDSTVGRGDFNFQCSSPHSEESKEEKFLGTIRDCFLFQNVQDRGTDNPSTIHLIFTDEENQITDLQYIKHLLKKSDHSVISFTFNCALYRPFITNQKASI